MESDSPRQRPLSPNIQIYRPQLTSVLSILNRLTGMLLSIAAIGLVIWLLAAAAGPQSYATVRTAFASWIGQVVLFGCMFAFFLHFLGGIRHLIWDTGRGLDLESIEWGAWAMVAGSIVLTLVLWLVILLWGHRP